MFLFEDGKIIEEAYVEIDGIKYPVHMPKYEGKTPLSSENLNKMQKELSDDMQTNIEKLSSNITLVQLWSGSIVVKANETKNVTVDCTEYDIIVYKVRSDYAHYQNVVRVVEENDVPYQVILYSTDNYNSVGTVKYTRSTKIIEFKCEQTKGWDGIVLEKIYGIKLNKKEETVLNE